MNRRPDTAQHIQAATAMRGGGNGPCEALIVHDRRRGRGSWLRGMVLFCAALLTAETTHAIESFLVAKLNHEFVQSAVGRDGTIYVLSEYNNDSYLVRYDRNGTPVSSPLKVSDYRPKRFVYAQHKLEADKDRLYVAVEAGSSDQLLKCTLDCKVESSRDTDNNHEVTDIAYSPDEDEIIIYGEDSSLRVIPYSSSLVRQSGLYWGSSSKYDAKNVTTDATGQIYAGYTDDANVLIAKLNADVDDKIKDVTYDVGGISSDESMNAVQYTNGFVYAGGFFKYEGNVEWTWGEGMTSETLYDGLLIRFDTNLANAEAAAVRGTNIRVVDLSADPEGNIYAVGTMAEGQAMFLHGAQDVPKPDSDEEDQLLYAKYGAPGNGLFVAKLDKDLQWKWVLLPTEIMPTQVKGIAVEWNEVNQKLMVSGSIHGEMKLGTTTVGHLGEWSGFLAVVNKDGSMADKVRLEIRAEANVTKDDSDAMQVRQDVEKMLSPVLPYRGDDVDLIKGSEVLASVPELLYFDANDEIIRHPNEPEKSPPTEQQIRNLAEKRFESTGYAVEDEPIQGSASSYKFEIQDDTALVFTWDVDYSLIVSHNLDGTQGVLDSEASGNPDPVVKKHWIPAQEIITAEIDGIVDDVDVDNVGRRFVPYAYWAGGASDPYNKSTGQGNILGEVPPVTITTSGGTLGGNARATLPSSEETHDRLLFRSTNPGSGANGQRIVYSDAGGNTDTADVAPFDGTTLTISLNEAYTTASTVMSSVNAAADASPFEVELMTGSDGSAPIFLHGGQSVALQGGDDGVTASTIVPDATSFSITRNDVGGEVLVTFVEATGATPVGAYFTEDENKLWISVELGTTTLGDVETDVNNLEGGELFGAVVAAADEAEVIDVLPVDVTMAKEEESVTPGVLADYTIEFTAVDVGTDGNDIEIEYETYDSWLDPSPVRVQTVGDLVTLRLNEFHNPTVDDVLAAVNEKGANNAPLYTITGALGTNVDGITQMPAAIDLPANPTPLVGGRAPRAAEAEFTIDHSDHSELVLEANELGERVYIEAEQVEAILRGVTFKTVDDGSVTGDSAEVDYDFGSTLTVRIDAGTTSLGKAIEAVNNHAKAKQVFAAKAADDSDGTGLLTPAMDVTAGGRPNTADTAAYMVERLDGVVFEAVGESDIEIQFLQVDVEDPTPVYDAGEKRLTLNVVLDQTTLGDIQQRAVTALDGDGKPLFTAVALTEDTSPDQVAFPDPANLSLQFAGGSLSRRAFLAFNPPGTDNELTFVAKQMGTHGNNYRIKLVEDATVAEDSPRISFSGDVVTITHSPDGATINSVREAIENYAKTEPSFPIEVSRETFYVFPALEDRQKVRQFVMDRPATITYEWKTQYSLQMSTTSSKSAALPYVQIQVPKGYQSDSSGSGEFWYDAGSHVKIGGRYRSGKQQLRGWNAGTGHMDVNGSIHDLREKETINGYEYRMAEIQSLKYGTVVQWDYGDRIFDQRITIGNPVNKEMIKAAAALPSNDNEYLQLTVYTDTKADTVTVVSGPPGTLGDNVQIWDDVADLFYPLRPSVYQIEWATSDPDHIVIARVTAGYPDAPVPNTLSYRITLTADGIELRHHTVSDTGGALREPFALLSEKAGHNPVLDQLRVKFPDSGGSLNEATVTYQDNLLTISINHGKTTGETIVDAINACANCPYTADTVGVRTLPLGDRFKGDPASWTHVTKVVNGVADIAPVNLEPSAKDAFQFLELGYSQSRALVAESKFTAAATGYSTLVFSVNESGIGKGDLSEEKLHVRTVRTELWSESLVHDAAVVGTKVTSAYDTAGLGTGAVVHAKSRYNIYVHDRLEPSGPIFPVNQHFTGDPEDDLVVVWYRNYLYEPQINWPYQTVQYAVTWPPTDTSNGYDRIVIASSLGSEGKKWVSDDDLTAGTAPEEQDVYDPELFGDITVYVQDDPAFGGYNPNEEHALTASSFLSRADPNPPQAAFALRNDLNTIDHDSTYTSDPFVLVQYRDLISDEWNMRIYKVEKYDTRDVYEFTIPNIDFTYSYMFELPTRAGEIILAPHPLDIVIGALPPTATYGVDLDPPANAPETKQKVYFEDHKGWCWSRSGDSDESDGLDDARCTVHFFYPLQPSFYYVEDHDKDGSAQTPGEPVPWLPPAGVSATQAASTALTQNVDAGVAVQVTVASTAGLDVGDYVGIADGERSEFGLRITKIEGQVLTIERMFLEKRSGAELSLRHSPVAVTYTSVWPDDVATLKVGETLTYSGGEFRADHPVSRNKYGDEFTTPGLPGVLAWAAGEIVFDSENPPLDSSVMGSDYTARLFPAMSTRQVPLSTADYELSSNLLPASGNIIVDEARYYFKGLSASLQKRVFYDPLFQKLGVFGILNDRVLGDATLTAAPPAVYVLEPNILTPGERDEILALSENTKWKDAVKALYNLTRDPKEVVADGAQADGWYAGLQLDPGTKEIEQEQALGVGLAVVANPGLLKPAATPGVRYVTLAENNHEDLGAAPVSLHIIRVVVGDKNTPQNNPNGLTAEHFRYRGALKTVLSDNVFDEKIIVRHTADFGGFADDLTFEWYYRGEDGTTALLPDQEPAKWLMFPVADQGVGKYQISLEGTGPVIIRDNWFFMRYRHNEERFPEDPAPPNDVAPYQWVGAGNSRPPDDGELPEETYLPQLVMGWVKRVLDAINPYEARIKDFKNNEAPATYVDMIQQLGQRYEGPVALNPDKDVIENVGLIELYTTVMERAKSLSIDLATPVTDGAVCNAIQLASTRLADFYMLLGNEAYADALDPTIGFGSENIEYGHMAPAIFTFQNQLDTLLDEELSLLRGNDEYHARPVYNRLFWNFTKGEGEAAYALSYNIADVTADGFIDEYDAMVMFPQGHGDAWGHYLTAIKTQYDLLQHSFFNWQQRSEFYNLMDIVLDVDYRDERKFAQIAAARARAGKAVVDSTYRDRYVEDPAGQWQGYTDTDEDRAWGVEGWARRAGQGAMFDWLAANALIPAEYPDPEADGIQRIDRSTVDDIDTIAAEFAAVEQQMDAANNGHNPLGVSPGAVPFDIDPTYLEVGSSIQGKFHFDQIYDRALAALRNAHRTFDYANELDNRVRKVATDIEAFAEDVTEQDRDLRNRLIEIFGTPHEGMIGPGKIYPEAYAGPDLILYQYVDVREVTNETVPEASKECKLFLNSFNQGIYPKLTVEEEIFGGMLGLDSVDGGAYENIYAPYFINDASPFNEQSATNVEYVTNDRVFELDLPVMAKGYAFVPPEDWGVRGSTGRIQQEIKELVILEAELAKAINYYDNLVYDFKRDFSDLNQRADTSNYVIKRMKDNKEKIDDLQDDIMGFSAAAEMFDWTADEIEFWIGAAMEAVPDNMVFGLASGGDMAAPAKAVLLIGGIAKTVFKLTALGFRMGVLEKEQELELYDHEVQIDIEEKEREFEIRELFHELASWIGEEPNARLDVFAQLERLTQMSDQTRTTIKEGWRLVNERKAFNVNTAAVVQRNRYKDMTFRVFRNDALQKYRAAFDLAARYVYLAAKAYDYETNLPLDHPASPQGILEDIVAARCLGAIDHGEPVIGPRGLADLLARLKENYDVLKPQFGVNNPQFQTGRFSLRHELFRIKPESYLQSTSATSAEIADANRLWRQTLARYRVDDLWQVAEYRRHCRPFTSKYSGAQPGLVIPMPTSIVAGENFFGKPAGAGDNVFNPTAFATKINAVGLWLENYDQWAMISTPYVYLVPAGSDVMYIPTGSELEVRTWNVEDQVIPAPFAIGDHELADPDWIPIRDSLSEGIGQIRRHASFRAYGDTGVYDENQMTFSTRLVGRSVWNTRWVLIIPGVSFDADPDTGLDTFIYGKLKPGGNAAGDPEQNRDLNGVKDLRLAFQTYSHSGI